MINIHDELIDIHKKYGMSEMANDKIQRLFDSYVGQEIRRLEKETNEFLAEKRSEYLL